MGWGKAKTVEARVNGAALIVAFHKANPPLVWKFDLERNHSFTLALQGEEGDWELGLTSPKGDFYPVTRFLTKDDAEESFAAVEKALAGKKFSPLWFGLKLIFIVLLLGAAFSIFNTLLYVLHARSAAPLSPMASAPSMPAPAPSPAAMPEGVPVPADQFLKAPDAPVPQGVPVPADQILKPPH